MVFLPESCYALHMRITVDISDELVAEAEARGLTPESYVRRLIDAAAHTKSLPLPPHRPTIDTETSLREIARYSK
jgi:antitoxin component of RelBE/YafQ-DinJ toxin-antitoxin module